MRLVLIPACALLVGFAAGWAACRLWGTADPWRQVELHRAHVEDPQNLRRDPRSGLTYVGNPPSIHPALAELVERGELEHVDLVFPTVPCSREATRLWMEACQHDEDIVYATGNERYVALGPRGDQPLHVQIWFRPSAEWKIRELIDRIDSLPRPAPRDPGVEPGPAAPGEGRREGEER